MISNVAHDTTAAATLTSSLLSNYACDAHPRHSTAAVPAKHLKAVTALALDGKLCTVNTYYYTAILRVLSHLARNTPVTVLCPIHGRGAAGRRQHSTL